MSATAAHVRTTAAPLILSTQSASGAQFIGTDEEEERLFGHAFRGLVSYMNARYPPAHIDVLVPQEVTW